LFDLGRSAKTLLPDREREISEMKQKNRRLFGHASDHEKSEAVSVEELAMHMSELRNLRERVKLAEKRSGVGRSKPILEKRSA
jgi:hypothetical protein